MWAKIIQFNNLQSTITKVIRKRGKITEIEIKPKKYKLYNKTSFSPPDTCPARS